jgi:hypothetical protein
MMTEPVYGVLPTIPNEGKTEFYEEIEKTRDILRFFDPILTDIHKRALRDHLQILLKEYDDAADDEKEEEM